jgi:hypothetical protein
VLEGSGAGQGRVVPFLLVSVFVRLTGRVTAEHDSNDCDRHDGATDSPTGVVAAHRRPATDADESGEILVLMVMVCPQECSPLIPAAKIDPTSEAGMYSN